MDAETIALFVIVGVIVAAIALHLIVIAVTLRTITSTLTKVKGGAQAIKGQTDPVESVIMGIAGDVAAIDDDLEGLLMMVGEAQASGSPPPPPPAARRTAPARRTQPRPAAAPAMVEVDAVDSGVNLDEMVDFDDDEAPPRPSMQEAVARARAGV